MWRDFDLLRFLAGLIAGAFVGFALYPLIRELAKRYMLARLRARTKRYLSGE